MMEKRPSKEQLATFKKNANDPSISAEIRAKFQAIVDKFENVGEEVVDAVEGKKERKPRTPKATTQRKPRATIKQTADDIEKAKAEIKARTGKTEEECEKIIDEYRTLRTKSQERKKKEAEASKTNVERINKLKKDDKVIEGTNEKTADAVIETTTTDVAKKIEKQIEAVEEKAETEAKKEVEKQMPKVSATEKKQAVKEKVEEKVKEKTKTIVKRVVIDTSALLTTIAESLGKFDKDSQKEFLIKLRSDIDKLISKYSFGGLTDGGVQVMNIQQSNLSSSSVNPTMFGGGGGIYSSDELYILKVFDLNGNLLDSSKRVRARNLSKAKEIAIDDFEYDMQQKYGSDLRFQVELAPSMMTNGGGVEGKKSRILEDFFVGTHPYDEFIIEQFRKDGTRMEYAQYNIGRTAQSVRKLPYRLMIGLDLERKLINDTLEKNAEFEVTSNKNGVKVLKIKYPSGVYRTAKLVEGERYDFDKGVGVKYSDGGGVSSDQRRKGYVHGYKFDNPNDRETFTNYLERQDIDYYTRNGVVATKMAISNKELRKIGISQEFSEFGNGGGLGNKTLTRQYLEKKGTNTFTFGYGMPKDAIDKYGTKGGSEYFILPNGDIYKKSKDDSDKFVLIGNKSKMSTGGGVDAPSEEDARKELKKLESEGKITLSIGNHGLIFMQIVKTGNAMVSSFKKSYESYLDALKHYYRVTNRFTEGGGIKDVIVYDNGGESFDRYTIFTPDGSVYGMSDNALMPNGFNLYLGDDTEVEKGSHLGKRLKSVPKSIEKAVRNRMSEYKRGGLLGESAKLEYIDEAFASDELQQKLREKLGLDSDANSLGDNVVISFAYTDYGGDFLDKVAIEYFKENYPENTLFEYAGYGGENAFVFGEPAQEWINSTEDYPLGFEDIEEFYYQMQNEAEYEGFEYFVDDLSRDYTFDKDQVMSWLMENKGGYYSVYPSGVDFYYGDLTDELLEEGLIKKEEMKRGGGVKGNQRDKYNKLIGRRDNEFYFLDDIFHHDDGFKGATGSIVVPVNKTYYDYATSYDGILERYMDAMGEDEWLDTLGLDRDDFEDEDEMMSAIEDGIWQTYLNGGLEPFEEVRYDLEEQMRNLPEFSDSDEFPLFEIIGVGRVFDKDRTFDEIYDQELYNKIREVEEFKRGGNVNTGRSWHLDRARHNKRENYEVPVSSRKKAHGGTIEQRMRMRRGM